ncbi:NfeD family protein [Persicobacter psychrovividus]|uniref:NfeD-like C-terminal domain-containing protein n=1 Tax=Persicobacter psychrovividus TaxID=387638 RepID=A0ABN6LEQ3_9BACT|nr:hypothetical protein PEPS_24130 [Persicobacter psychrovividus]
MLLIALLIIVGIILLLVEVIFVPGTTFVGVIGAIAVIFGIYLSYTELGTSAGHWVLAGSSVVGIILSIYAFQSKPWLKMSNQSSVEGRVNTRDAIGLMIGQEGLTTSALKPVGKALFGETEEEVSTRGLFLEAGTAIEIIEIYKNKIIVQPLKIKE